MTREALLAEILKLPPDQQVELIERVWDEIAVSPDDISMPEWHREELERRLNDPTEQATHPWDEVMRQLELPDR